MVGKSLAVDRAAHVSRLRKQRLFWWSLIYADMGSFSISLACVRSCDDLSNAPEPTMCSLFCICVLMHTHSKLSTSQSQGSTGEPIESQIVDKTQRERLVRMKNPKGMFCIKYIVTFNNSLMKASLKCLLYFSTSLNLTFNILAGTRFETLLNWRIFTNILHPTQSHVEVHNHMLKMHLIP